MDDRAALDGDAGAEDDVRLDHHVLADLSVEGEENRFRRDHRDAGDHQFMAAALLPDRSIRASSARLLQPVSSASGASTAMARAAARANDLDDVGEVVLALDVGIADLAEQLERLGAVDRHQAAIAIGDASFLFGGILLARGSPSARRSRRSAGHSRSARPVWKPMTTTSLPSASACRAAISGAAVISGVSPKTTRISSYPLAIASRRRQNRMPGTKAFGLQEGRNLDVSRRCRRRRDRLSIPPDDQRDRRNACIDNAIPPHGRSSADRPTGCSTFDIDDFIRVLSPAAKITARHVRVIPNSPAFMASRFGGRHDSARYIAGRYCKEHNPGQRRLLTRIKRDGVIDGR